MSLPRAAVAVVLVVLPGITAHRVQVWGDERALWQEAVAHSPQKPRPWVNLGRQLALHGAQDLAAEMFRQAMTLSADADRVRVEGAMRGGDVAALNLAIVYAQQGRYDEALQITASIQPRSAGRYSLVTMLETSWIRASLGWVSSGF